VSALAQTVKKNTAAWKRWLKTSEHRDPSGADPLKYSTEVLQLFVNQLPK
jgi:hypothetical protein